MNGMRWVLEEEEGCRGEERSCSLAPCCKKTAYGFAA